MKALLIICVCALTVTAFIPPHWNEWRVGDRADSAAKVTVFVGLHQRNVPELERLATEISTPGNALYGKHMKSLDVLEIIAPPKEEQIEVEAWLWSKGAVSVLNFGDAIKAVMTVKQAEDLFECHMHLWQHEKSGHKVIRVGAGEKLALPDRIAELTEMITGLVDFPRIKKEKKKSAEGTEAGSDGTTDSTYIYPGIIKQRYDIPADLKVTNIKSTQCAMEFWPQPAPMIDDLKHFAKDNELPYNAYVEKVGQYEQGGGGESTLDVELLASVAVDAQNWYWTITGGWSYEMALELFNHPSPPLVVSVSYGWPEVHTCQSAVTNANCTNEDAEQYVGRSNVELAKVAALGLSVLVADQDEGAPSEANPSCNDKQMPVYSIYPASSPWVTAVSSTTMLGYGTASDSLPPLCKHMAENNPGHACMTNATSEAVTMNDNTAFGWSTGGGFSAYGHRPSYQDAMVKSYLSNPGAHLPSIFPKTMRGYPDVSAVGDRIVVFESQITFSAGTSASTPIFSAIVTLLNDAMLNAGKKPLGFLNPLLYKMADSCQDCFYDITNGTNACGQAYGCQAPCEGYTATTGWDAASGLGTPRFQAMRKWILENGNN